jgi:hypothetical protein
MITPAFLGSAFGSDESIKLTQIKTIQGQQRHKNAEYQGRGRVGHCPILLFLIYR